MRTRTPAATSAELIKQSEALRQQAEALKRQEVPGVVARIKEAIAHYGLSAADLGLDGQPARKTAAKKATRTKPQDVAAAAVDSPVENKPAKLKKDKKAAAPVKYRDQAGHSWSGFGPKPGWFKDALAAGATEASLKA